MSTSDIPTDGPWEAVHHPEGSVIQPVGSNHSILMKISGTPCLSRGNADLIVAAVNEYRRLHGDIDE